MIVILYPQIKLVSQNEFIDKYIYIYIYVCIYSWSNLMRGMLNYTDTLSGMMYFEFMRCPNDNFL